MMFLVVLFSLASAAQDFEFDQYEPLPGFYIPDEDLPAAPIRARVKSLFRLCKKVSRLQGDAWMAGNVEEETLMASLIRETNKVYQLVNPTICSSRTQFVWAFADGDKGLDIRLGKQLQKDEYYMKKADKAQRGNICRGYTTINDLVYFNGYDQEVARSDEIHECIHILSARAGTTILTKGITLLPEGWEARTDMNRYPGAGNYYYNINTKAEQQDRPGSKAYKLKPFNEGITQVLTEIVCQDLKIEVTPAYAAPTAFVRKLRESIGLTHIYNAYANSDVEGLLVAMVDAYIKNVNSTHLLPGWEDMGEYSEVGKRYFNQSLSQYAKHDLRPGSFSDGTKPNWADKKNAKENNEKSRKKIRKSILQNLSKMQYYHILDLPQVFYERVHPDDFKRVERMRLYTPKERENAEISIRNNYKWLENRLL